MSLWRFTDKPLKVGDTLDGYTVLKIKQAVPVSVQVRNADARQRNCPEEPEVLHQCVQLIGKSPMPKETLGFEYTCQKCLKRKKTTHSRSIYTKDYVGPCGDSFCFASCDMSSCRPIHVTVCEDCATKLSKKT